MTSAEKSPKWLEELPVHLKASGLSGLHKSGEKNPGRQEQLYFPGMLVQTELGPQSVEFLEHSSTSKQKIKRMKEAEATAAVHSPTTDLKPMGFPSSSGLTFLNTFASL